MWIEIEGEDLLVNLDTGVRIEVAGPNSVSPCYAVTIHMCGLAYFADRGDAMKAFDELRKLVKPVATLRLAGTVDLPDPFAMLGMKSPINAPQYVVGSGDKKDWMQAARDLGVQIEQEGPKHE